VIADVAIPTTAQADSCSKLDPPVRKPTVLDVLRAAEREKRVALQPRCGFGDHQVMRSCLVELEARARPDILSITVDSFTRLGEYDRASQALVRNGGQLNGYPLVAHGAERVRELDRAVQAPLEIRHGSPDPRRLFEVAVGAGIGSFEGGGIGYNLPYAKDFPLADSLRAWDEVDSACGDLARDGMIVDRELFGTLSAVLVPPSISLAITTLEAVAAASAGVRCLSIAYPQGGCSYQDVAALKTIRRLARRYLPDSVETFPVLHQFMGVFPKERERANELIRLGALVARLGGATKVVTKTHQEANGIPTVAANAEGVRTARFALSDWSDSVEIDHESIEEEAGWLTREVIEIVDPVLDSADRQAAIVSAFAEGRLDIPFSASIHSHSALIPKRDQTGAIRYQDFGGLPFSKAVGDRNRRLLEGQPDAGASVMEELLRDIYYFAPEGRS
jgi:methylaspartate mutase epsilon subunit